MTRLAAPLLRLAVMTPGLASAQSCVNACTVLRGQANNCDASIVVDLTLTARDGKFLH